MQIQYLFSSTVWEPRPFN